MKPKCNVKLFNRVCKAILKHHRQFNMDWWFMEENSAGRPAAGCGTAACLAGFTIAVDRKTKTLREANKFLFPREKATEALQIDPWQANCLFYENNWPHKFWQRYNNAKVRKDTLGAARAAVARVKHFLKTGE